MMLSLMHSQPACLPELLDKSGYKSMVFEQLSAASTAAVVWFGCGCICGWFQGAWNKQAMTF
jgi:hypothetical protein